MRPLVLGSVLLTLGLVIWWVIHNLGPKPLPENLEITAGAILVEGRNSGAEPTSKLRPKPHRAPQPDPVPKRLDIPAPMLTLTTSETAPTQLEALPVVTRKGAEAGLADKPKPSLPFTLQVGSFSKKTHAEKLVARLKDRGEDAYLLPVTLKNKGQRWRVRVAHFASAQEAEWARLDLMELGITPIVVQTNR